MKIHHIAIIVKDRTQSLKFYQDILGFKLISEVYREERKSWKIDLKRNEIQLEIFTFPDAPARPSYPEARGLRHLAFAVENVEQWNLDLKAMGIEVEEIKVDPLTLKKFFFIQDPDDQPLEFYQS